MVLVMVYYTDVGSSCYYIVVSPVGGQSGEVHIGRLCIHTHKSSRSGCLWSCNDYCIQLAFANADTLTSTSIARQFMTTNMRDKRLVGGPFCQKIHHPPTPDEESTWEAQLISCYIVLRDVC